MIVNEHLTNTQTLINLMDVESQNKEIEIELKSAVNRVISSNVFIKGDECSQFERNFSQKLGINDCLSVGNGTDALEIGIEALEIDNNSEILVPLNTFVGSIEAIIRAGCKPKFCRFSTEDLNICVKDAQKQITPNTKAIMAVHLYGRPANISALRKLCDEYNLYLIEDCAQAHFATNENKIMGTVGDIAGFSFYPGKNLGAFGDAGALVAKSNDVLSRARLISNHGRSKKYDHEILGRNSRMDELNAAVLNVKLNYIYEWTERRRRNADMYYQKLSNVSKLKLPVYDVGNVYHLFPIIVDMPRDDFRNSLKDRGVETGLHYPKLLHQLPPYRKFASECYEDLVKVNNSIVTIPMHENLQSQVAEKVAAYIQEVLS